MQCPNCKLINPPGAVRCDCGYDFTTRRVPTQAVPVGVAATGLGRASLSVLVLACCLLGGFFLPWFQLFGVGVSGFQLGKLGSYGNYAWIIPILAGATILVSVSRANNRFIGALAGIVPLAAIAYAIYRLASEAGQDAVKALPNILGQVLSIGAYVTILASISIIVAAAIPPSTPTRHGHPNT